MKKLWAILAGLSAAFCVVIVIEIISHKLYPLPENVDPNNYEQMAALLKKAPTGSLLIVALGHLLGMFVGVSISLRILKELSAAYIVGGLFMLLTLGNLFMLPHQTWFMVADIAAVLLGGLIPYMAFKKRLG
ncbi:MAG: hypothetical protein ABJG68_11025 [Crocinitomicaceae bacterium]